VSADPIELRLRGPGGEPVDLWRTLVSHGFAELAPMSLDEEARTLDLTLRVPRGRPRRVRIRAGRRNHVRVELLGGGAASDGVRDAVALGAAHVLRLDQDLSRFYALAAEDPDLAWAALGAGRMLRSPTVWEDLVKTLCTTNCSWGLTTFMVQALVRELGEPAAGFAAEPLANAFPTPRAMADRDEGFYREVVHAGYRAPSIVRLSALAADGDIDLERLGATPREELPDEDVEALLRSLPGIGPYAAAHVMMTLGRNSRLILDSWTRPTYARAAGRTKPASDAAIERRFRRYGDDAGLAFWLFVTKHWVDADTA
jgi:3-methyladenine DNA glycosylase/8-oxoguanine DNA glycosylase